MPESAPLAPELLHPAEADGMEQTPAKRQRVAKEKTPAKRQCVAKEKTAEQIAAAEAKKAAKAAEKQQEKEERAAAREAAKVAKAAEAAAEKEQRTALKEYAKSLGDSIKMYVQGRSKSLATDMTPAQYRHIFAGFLHLQCSKKITTESIFGDGRVETQVQHIAGKLYLSEREVQSVFGIGKTKGGSYSGFYGATTWCITEMEVDPPTAERATVSMRWKLSSGADWSK